MKPSSLDFNDVYLGDERTIDLSVLTLNGQPLKDPDFDLLPRESTFSFDLVHGGPLGTSPLLVFSPHQEGVLTQSFFVKAGGETFEVEATGRGKRTPECPKPESCHRATFSFTEEKCVVETVRNGALCGPSDCEGDQVCEDGACTYVVRENAPPVCKQDVPSVTLQPAWTYEADPNREVSFPGLVDAEGNLYLYDCLRSESTTGRCDIVSLTADGHRRWRIPESGLPMYPHAPDLAIIGGSLFVFGTENDSNVVLAFRLTDGSLAWQRADIHALVPSSPARAAAVLESREIEASSAVLILDTETGAELSRVSDVVPGWTNGTTVSDGQGTLYTNSAPLSDVPNLLDNVTSAVSLEQGRLWSVAVTGNDNVQATDGTRLFTGGKQVLNAADGQPLYADPGLRDEICFNSTQQAIFTTLPGPGMVVECRESNLRRLGLNDGVEQSGCRPYENDVPLFILTSLVPTRDGGTIFLGAPSSIVSDPTEKVSLRWSDADGNAVYRAKLDGLVYGNVPIFLGPGAIVKGRWVMSGRRPSGGTAIIVYDVPGLALAEHGWLSPSGSQARNYAPW